MDFLEIEDLSIDLGEFKLVDVNLKVKKGDYLTIIGPTGSGKSILLETIAGFYKPKKGRVYLEGEDITDLPPEKRNMSIVYQDYVLFPHKTVFDNIAYGLKKKIKDKDKIKEEITQITEVLNISHLLHRKPDTLSGGEQQRVALARALILNHSILLLDEPTSAVDIKIKESIISELKKIKHIPVLHITHDLAEARTLGEKIGIFMNGELIAFGDKDILKKPNTKKVAEFLGFNIIENKAIAPEDVIIKDGNEGEIVNIDFSRSG